MSEDQSTTIISASFTLLVSRADSQDSNALGNMSFLFMHAVIMDNFGELNQEKGECLCVELVDRECVFPIEE